MISEYDSIENIMGEGENAGYHYFMKSWTSLKMSHVGSKPRSVGQILENPYFIVCSRGRIFSLTIMKLDQHVCLDEISL